MSVNINNNSLYNVSNLFEKEKGSSCIRSRLADEEKQEWSCSICLCENEDDEAIVEHSFVNEDGSTLASHKFHKACIEGVFNSEDKRCPICRQDLLESEDVKQERIHTFYLEGKYQKIEVLEKDMISIAQILFNDPDFLKNARPFDQETEKQKQERAGVETSSFGIAAILCGNREFKSRYLELLGEEDLGSHNFALTDAAIQIAPAEKRERVLENALGLGFLDGKKRFFLNQYLDAPAYQNWQIRHTLSHDPEVLSENKIEKKKAIQKIVLKVFCVAFELYNAL